MSSKKRYTNSFLLTFSVYVVLALLAFLSFKPIVSDKTLSKEKTIALSHISLISQEKQEIKEKQKPKKEEIKKEELKEEIISKPIKEEPIKPKEKKEEEKRKEEPKKELMKEPRQEEQKEQEALQKAVPKNYEQAFLDEHLQQIVKLIQENIIYPKRAKKLNIQGEVLVEFKILKNGKVENIEAIKGHALLKKSALDAIELASKAFPKVQKDMTIKVPIVYSLVSGEW